MDGPEACAQWHISYKSTNDTSRAAGPLRHSLWSEDMTSRVSVTDTKKKIVLLELGCLVQVGRRHNLPDIPETAKRAS